MEITSMIESERMKRFSMKDFLFFNIAPYSPGLEEQLARDMIDYRERTGNDVILYSLTLHPQGFPAMKKAEEMLESYRILKGMLAGSGIRLGVLMQSTLGHWRRVDKQEESWTRSVDIDGREVRFCVLDERFQHYLAEVVTLLAKEKPVFIMTDDDIRASCYAGLPGIPHRPECFCQLHTDQFNHRMGTSFTPEQYRQAVLDSKPGNRIFTAFYSECRERVNGIAKLIRQAVDAVDPSIIWDLKEDMGLLENLGRASGVLGFTGSSNCQSGVIAHYVRASIRLFDSLSNPESFIFRCRYRGCDGRQVV